MRKILFISFVLINLLSGCEVETVESSPEVGPNGSWFLGGVDGGVYLNVIEDDNPNDKIYDAEIYFDGDKTIWYKGPLKLVGNDAFSPENKKLYVAWDGTVLILKEGYLEPTQPIPPI